MAVTPDYSDYAFISIGANLPSGADDPVDTIRDTFDRLEQLSVGGMLRSSLYLTSPVDSPAGTPDFFNAMAGIIPAGSETPLSLLHKLQAIENAAGRTRSGTQNEARTLDLDLITFRDEILDTDELTLPHPRARERQFVLLPMMEITSMDFELPGTERSLKSCSELISTDQQIQLYSSGR